MGIVGMLVIVCAVLSAVLRLRCALLSNGRYRFTTWRWGRVLAVLMLVGIAMKVMSTT